QAGRLDDREDRQVSRASLPNSGVTSVGETWSVSWEGITPPSSLVPTHSPLPLGSVVACVRLVIDGKTVKEARTFSTTTADLMALSEWLTEHPVATGRHRPRSTFRRFLLHWDPTPTTH